MDKYLKQWSEEEEQEKEEGVVKEKEDFFQILENTLLTYLKNMWVDIQ